jgi:hypothetical protein
MKIDDLWKTYQHYTRDLTEHSRKLAFAVAVICWFFKSPEITFPPAVFWSLVLLVGFFFFDVCHYLCGAIIYRIFIHRREAELGDRLDENSEVLVPRWLDRTGFTLFCVKSAFLLASFVMLAVEFYFRLSASPKLIECHH